MVECLDWLGVYRAWVFSLFGFNIWVQYLGLVSGRGISCLSYALYHGSESWGCLQWVIVAGQRFGLGGM